MARYFAERYLVGGAYTHGGEYEHEIPTQPAGLKRVWDQDDNEWRELLIDGVPTWVPFSNGHPIPEPLELDWLELLIQFGPVTDTLPEYALAGRSAS